MEKYREQLKKMNNEELLNELIGINTYSAEGMPPAELSDAMDNEVRCEIFYRMSLPEKKLEKVFEDGRSYEAGELELNTAGRNTTFEVYYEDIYLPLIPTNYDKSRRS